jgi:hypothetical protein
MFKNRKIKKNRIEIAKKYEEIVRIQERLEEGGLDMFDRVCLERDVNYLFYEMRCLVGENKRLRKKK